MITIIFVVILLIMLIGLLLGRLTFKDFLVYTIVICIAFILITVALRYV